MATKHAETVTFFMPSSVSLTECGNASHTFHIPTTKTSSDITCKSFDSLCTPIAFCSHRAFRQIRSRTNESGQVRAQSSAKKSLLLLKKKKSQHAHLRKDSLACGSELSARRLRPCQGNLLFARPFRILTKN